MRKNNNIKFFIFILLFLSLGIVYAPNSYAAFGGGGGPQFDGGGEIVEQEANVGWNIKSVAACWSDSDGWVYASTSDEKKKLDNPIGAFSHLTFDNSGVFNAEASSSENVTEYGGFIEYLVPWENAATPVNYTKKSGSADSVYKMRKYKYIELSKEGGGLGERDGFTRSGKTADGNSFTNYVNIQNGTWLYYYSDQTSDLAKIGALATTYGYYESMMMLDVNTGETLGVNGNLFWDTPFMWPVSSNGKYVATRGHGNGGVEVTITVGDVLAHNPQDLRNLSNEKNFGLAWFQHDNSGNNVGVSYLTYNPSCELIYTIPSGEEIKSILSGITGIDYGSFGASSGYNTEAYWRQPKAANHLNSEQSAGLKHMVHQNNADLSNTLMTYPDPDNHSIFAHCYFLKPSGYNYHFSTRTVYTTEDGQIGRQMFSPNMNNDSTHKAMEYTAKEAAEVALDSDELSAGFYSNNPSGVNFNITTGVVNDKFRGYRDADFTSIPPQFVETFQRMVRTKPLSLRMFINVAKNHSVYNKSFNVKSGQHSLSSVVSEYFSGDDTALVNGWSSLIAEDPELAYCFMAGLFRASVDKFEWQWFACDGVNTKIYFDKAGWYNSYLSAACFTIPNGSALKFGHESVDIEIVDVFKAFHLDLNTSSNIIATYESTGNVSAPGLSARQANVIKAALEGSRFTGGIGQPFTTAVLTKAEIIDGMINFDEADATVFSNYMPYVIVAKTTYTTGYDYADNTQGIPVFDGTNEGAITSKLQYILNRHLTEDGAFKDVDSRQGFALFHESFENYEGNPEVDIIVRFGTDEVEAKKENILDSIWLQEKDNPEAGVRDALHNMEKGLENSSNQWKEYTYKGSGKSSGYYRAIRVSSKTSDIDLKNMMGLGNCGNNVLNSDNWHLKASIAGTDSKVGYYFAPFCVESYSPTYSNGKLYYNERETVNKKGVSLIVYPSESRVSTNGASTRETKSMEIYAAPAGIAVPGANGKTMSIKERDVYAWAQGNKTGYVGQILNHIFSSNQKIGDRNLYDVFATSFSSLQTTKEGTFKIDTSSTLLRLGRPAGEANNLAQAFFDYVNGSSGPLKLNQLINVGTYEFALKNRNREGNLPIAASVISTMFDTYDVCKAQINVTISPEDLIVSTSNNFRAEDGSSHIAEQRKVIDWFGKDYDLKAYWGTNYEGTEIAIETKEVKPGQPEWWTKEDLANPTVSQKKALFPKNALNNPAVAATQISGKISVGRIPEAMAAGLRVGDYKLVMFEEFLTNDEVYSEFNTLNHQLRQISKESSSVASYWNKFSDSYAEGVLLSKYASNSITPFANMKLEIVNYDEVNGEIPRVIGKLNQTLPYTTKTSGNYNSLVWTPGMVVNYKFTYSLPYGSQPTTVKYITDNAGSIYSRMYTTDNFYRINYNVLHFTLVPRTNSYNGKVVTYNGTAKNNTYKYNHNFNNDEAYIISHIPDGGNMEWYDTNNRMGVRLQVAGGTTTDITVEQNGTDYVINLNQLMSANPDLIDASGVLTKDLTVTIYPILHYENMLLGKGGKSYHQGSNMEVRIIDTGILWDGKNPRSENASLSRKRLSSAIFVQKQENANSGQGSCTLVNDTVSGKGTKSNGGNLISNFYGLMAIEIPYKKGAALYNAELTNMTSVWVPGTDVSACPTNDVRCGTDNSRSDDWECINLIYTWDPKKDNKVVDIVCEGYTSASNFESPGNMGALGDNNLNVDNPASQNLYNGRNNPTSVKLTAIVERIESLGGNIKEADEGKENQQMVGFWTLDYTQHGEVISIEKKASSGINRPGNCKANGQLPAGTYNYRYKKGGSLSFNLKDTLATTGDRIGYQTYIAGGRVISELRVEFGYRNNTSHVASYDNYDNDIDNNVRIEEWDTGFDCVVQITEVPADIFLRSGLYCDEHGEIIKEEATGHEPLDFDVAGTVTFKLEDGEDDELVYDFNYDIVMYGRYKNKFFYPELTASTGYTKVGSATSVGRPGINIRTNALGTINVYGSFKGVDINTETTADKDGNSGYNPGYTGQDEGEFKIFLMAIPKNYPHHIPQETDQWDPAVVDSHGNKRNSNNYAEDKFNIAKIEALGCKQDWCDRDKAEWDQANEARWTDRFTWTNYVNNIADWRQIKPNVQKREAKWDFYMLGTNPYNLTTTFVNFDDSSTGIQWVNQQLNISWSQCYSPRGPANWSKHSGYRGWSQYCNLPLVRDNMWYIKEINVRTLGSYIHDHMRYDHTEYGTDSEGNPTSHDVYVPEGNPHPVYFGLFDAYLGKATLSGIAWGSPSSCNNQRGPDDGMSNWGPNGLMEGQTNNAWVNFQNDNPIGKGYGDTPISKYNKTKIPTTYYNYIYKGKNLRNNAGSAPIPKYLGTDSALRNWDTLGKEERLANPHDGGMAGNLKYHFYSEKITTYLQIATSGTSSKESGVGIDNFKTIAEDSTYVVYTGEAFIVRAVIEYHSNYNLMHMPHSPVMQVELSPGSRYTGSLYTHCKGTGAYYNNEGWYIKTNYVENGKVMGRQNEWCIIDMETNNGDENYKLSGPKTSSRDGAAKRVSGKYWQVRTGFSSSNGTKPYSRTYYNNKWWDPNEGTVDSYSGAFKSWYNGSGYANMSGDYNVNSGTAWFGIPYKVNFFAWGEDKLGLVPWKSSYSISNCNTLSVTSPRYSNGGYNSVGLRFRITGTKAYNGTVETFKKDTQFSKASLGIGSDIYFKNVYWVLGTYRNPIHVPITNQQQTITIDLQTWPIVGNRGQKYHPYTGYTNKGADIITDPNGWLCDTYKAHILIKPIGAIVGDVEVDDNKNVQGEGGWSENDHDSNVY